MRDVDFVSGISRWSDYTLVFLIGITIYIYTRHSLQGRDKAISGKDERNTRANVISNRDSYDVRAGKNRDKRRVEGYSIRDRESENTG